MKQDKEPTNWGCGIIGTIGIMILITIWSLVVSGDHDSFCDSYWECITDWWNCIGTCVLLAWGISWLWKAINK